MKISVGLNNGYKAWFCIGKAFEGQVKKAIVGLTWVMVCVKPLLLLQIGALDLKKKIVNLQVSLILSSFYSPLVEAKEIGATTNR